MRSRIISQHIKCSITRVFYLHKVLAQGLCLFKLTQQYVQKMNKSSTCAKHFYKKENIFHHHFPLWYDQLILLHINIWEQITMVSVACVMALKKTSTILQLITDEIWYCSWLDHYNDNCNKQHVMTTQNTQTEQTVWVTFIMLHTYLYLLLILCNSVPRIANAKALTYFQKQMWKNTDVSKPTNSQPWMGNDGTCILELTVAWRLVTLYLKCDPRPSVFMPLSAPKCKHCHFIWSWELTKILRSDI